MMQSSRSKKELANALLQLMNQKSFSKITITEIAEHALLDRRTFYRHFQSKAAIITYYCDELCLLYVKRLEEEPSIDTGKIVALYFSFWYDHQLFIQSLIKNKLQFYILKMFDRYLLRIRSLYSGKTISFESSVLQTYALAFNVGGLFNALIVWAENDFKETPKEMEKIMLQAFSAIVVEQSD